MKKINMTRLAKKTAQELNENWVYYMDTYKQIDTDRLIEMDSKDFDLYQLADYNNQHLGFEWIIKEFGEAANEYGKTTYNDEEYALTEQAQFAGLENLRIDNSIYVLDSNNYSASCIDKDGNEYTAYFVVKNEDTELEDSCDWQNASYI